MLVYPERCVGTLDSQLVTESNRDPLRGNLSVDANISIDARSPLHHRPMNQRFTKISPSNIHPLSYLRPDLDEKSKSYRRKMNQVSKNRGARFTIREVGGRGGPAELANFGEQRPLKWGEITVISAYPAAISPGQNRTFDRNIKGGGGRASEFERVLSVSSSVYAAFNRSSSVVRSPLFLLSSFSNYSSRRVTLVTRPFD